MYLKPKCLSNASLEAETLRADKKSCKRYDPCGVGQKALYLNNIVLDRCYYIPLDSVQRVYKRVAMSKGGYTGKGISVPFHTWSWSSTATSSGSSPSNMKRTWTVCLTALRRYGPT